ncbi:MAG TPA: hypothetical protein VM840_06460 [Actinomycetota bacterium]|nr:hypothetical protein [Actinomycetota bacterium]
MDEQAIAEALDRAERSVLLGQGLGGTGFWRAVSEVRRRPELVEAFAERIGRIDRMAFERGVRLRVPLGPGLAGLWVATISGAVLVVVAPRIGEHPVGTAAFLAGFGALLVGSHSLAHHVTGRAFGMRFTHVFLGGPPPPRPGVKTDYATYLRVPPRRRALMHASGAVVTKILPFALIPSAADRGLWRGLVPLLVGVGVLQIVTDVLFSTKVSDWKKVRRELRAARSS